MARLRAEDAARRQQDLTGDDYSEALARGLAVITAFNEERQQQSLSDLARVVDLPKATVRRALNTLLKLGFAEKNERMYRLTPRVLTLATAYLSSSGVASLAQPICERVSHQLTSTCALGILDDTEVLIVAKEEPRRMLSALPAVGYRVSAVSSSLGRVILSALDDDDMVSFVAAAELPANTPYTVTDRKVVAAAIRASREDGFSIVDQEVELGFRSISVPVRHFSGSVVGAFHIGGRVEAASVERLKDEFLPVLREAAKELSAQLPSTSR